MEKSKAGYFCHLIQNIKTSYDFIDENIDKLDSNFSVESSRCLTAVRCLKELEDAALKAEAALAMFVYNKPE